MKKNLNYILIFLLFSSLISCGKDEILTTEAPIEKKDVSFLFQVGEVTNKPIYENRKLNETTVQKDIEDAVAVIVTIQAAPNTILINYF